VTAFADTSALVKLYVDEPGAAEVRGQAAPFTVSAVARVEVVSALARKNRSGALAGDVAHVFARHFEADWHGSGDEPSRFTIVDAGPSILNEAAALVRVHPLGALDAIQLASAVLARRAAPELDTFLTFDDRLRDAAAAEGFAVVPAST